MEHYWNTALQPHILRSPGARLEQRHRQPSPRTRRRLEPEAGEGNVCPGVFGRRCWDVVTWPKKVTPGPQCPIHINPDQGTDRVARLMPFMMIVSSGTACKSFAMRDKRSNFTMRNIPRPNVSPQQNQYSKWKCKIELQFESSLILLSVSYNNILAKDQRSHNRNGRCGKWIGAPEG